MNLGINAGYLTGGKAFNQAVKDGKMQLDIAQNNQSNIKKLLMGRISCYLNDKLAILA